MAQVAPGEGATPIAILPTRIDRYRVLRSIARGGTAEVYEVQDDITGEHLALKLLVQSGGTMARFNREYEAMVRLNHPNIVRVYHYGFHDGSPWFTMEYVQGALLQTYIKECGRPGSDARNKEVVRAVHDLALALDHIHRRGLVHRDLKSANVLVLPDGRIRLVDFGAAKVHDAMEAITAEGEIIGTFSYASPEQLRSATVDRRSDLYSLGVLMYRLATGKLPFRAKDLYELARQQVREKPRPPSSLVSGLPNGLEELIQQMLEKDPEARPQSGAEVAKALERVAGRPLFLSSTVTVDPTSERAVGRENELRELVAFLDGMGGRGAEDSPGATPGALALVVGFRGSGRLRVISTVEREMRIREWPVLRCDFQRGDGGDVARSLLGGIHRLFDDPRRTNSEDLVADLLAVADAMRASIPERVEALWTIGARVIGARCELSQCPIGVVARGLHKADSVGLEALARLRESLAAAGTPVLFVAGSQALTPQEEARRGARLPEDLRVTLEPLAEREVGLFVGSLLRRRPPPLWVTRKIHRASGGMPAFVEDVVQRMVDDGLVEVRRQEGYRVVWTGAEEAELDMPDRAREQIVRRLRRLPSDRRRVLEALALMGGHASCRVLASALQWRLGETWPAIRDLLDCGWIEVEAGQDGPWAQWRQILVQPIVLEHLSEARRRILERRLVIRVAEQPAFDAQIRLLLSVGRTDEAFRRALDWSAHQLSKHRPVTAMEALDLVAPHIGSEGHLDPAERAQLYLLHASCLVLAARSTDPRAASSAAAAAELAAQLDDHFRAEVLHIQAWLKAVVGDYENFRLQLMEAWKLVEHLPPSPLASRVAGLLGQSNHAAGNVDDAAVWHGRSRRIAVDLGYPGVRARADIGVARWQYARGLLREAEGTARGALAVFDEIGDPDGLTGALGVWAAALRSQGRFSEAMRVLHPQVDQMRGGEVPSFYVRVLLAIAWCEVELRRLGRAQEWVDELGATLRTGEHIDLRLEADLLLGRILLDSGQYPQAHRRLGSVVRLAGKARLHVFAERARALLGAVQYRLGDRPAARRSFLRAVRELQAHGDVAGTAHACIARAQVMAEQVDPAEIFAPVRDYIEGQPAAIARVEWHLAQGRFIEAQGESPASAHRAARAVLQRMEGPLDDTDTAALRLHRWWRQARE